MNRLLLPVIDPDTGEIDDQTPVEEPEDTATEVADRTYDYPLESHSRIKDSSESDREKIKSHLKRSMRVQHKLKIIDNT